jgi:hypothetical protein
MHARIRLAPGLSPAVLFVLAFSSACGCGKAALPERHFTVPAEWSVLTVDKLAQPVTFTWKGGAPNGPLHLSATAPDGISITFTPADLSPSGEGGTVQATMTVERTADVFAAHKNIPVYLRGPDWSDTETVGLTLPDSPIFLSLGKPSLHVQPGATATLDLTGHGAIGDSPAISVDWQATAPPAGITADATFGPCCSARNTQGSGRITFTAGWEALPATWHTILGVDGMQGTTPTVTGHANFDLVIDPLPVKVKFDLAKVNLILGSAVAVNVTVTGPVGPAPTMDVTGLPTGVTAAPLTLTAAADGLSATGRVVFTASASAVTGDSTAVFKVTPPAPYPGGQAGLDITVLGNADFALSAPANASVVPGGSVTVPVGITRNALSGEVVFTLQSPPAGISATYTPSGPTSTSTNVTFAAAAAVATGSYALTLVGTVGTVVHTAVLTLDVRDFSLAATDVTATAGSSGTGTATATLVNGFAGAIVLSLQSPPAGVTIQAATIASGATSSPFTLDVASSVVGGTYSLTVVGTGGGAARTAAFTLTVSGNPDFSLSVAPSPVSVPAGGSIATTVTVSRANGFAGAVTLSLVSPPAGVTATFTPNPASGATANLQLDVLGTVAPGSKALTVQGTNAALVHTAPLTLNVTTAPSVTVTSYVNGDTANADFAAYQDGNGAWQPLSGANGSYSFPVTDAAKRYGLALACSGTSGPLTATTVRIFHAVQSELPGVVFGCMKPVTGFAVSGAITNGSASTAAFAVGVSASTATASYALAGVPGGTRDLLLAALPASGPATKVVLDRATTLSAPLTRDVDFGTEGFVPTSQAVTLTNVPAAATGAGEVDFFTSGATFAQTGAVSGTTGTFWGIPVASQVSGDVHLLRAKNADGSTPAATQSIERWFVTPADQTADFAAIGPFGAAAVTAPTATPYALFKADFDNAGVQLYQLSFKDPTRDWAVLVTPAWLGAGATHSYSVPDLSAVSGFDPTWGEPAGQATDWAVRGIVSAGSRRDTQVGLAWPVLGIDGLEIRSAGKAGTVTP